MRDLHGYFGHKRDKLNFRLGLFSGRLYDSGTHTSENYSSIDSSIPQKSKDRLVNSRSFSEKIEYVSGNVIHSRTKSVGELIQGLFVASLETPSAACARSWGTLREYPLSLGMRALVSLSE